MLVWNAMIPGCTQKGLDEKGLELFVKMENVTELSPDTTTLSHLSSCFGEETCGREKRLD